MIDNIQGVQNCSVSLITSMLTESQAAMSVFALKLCVLSCSGSSHIECQETKTS